MNLKIVLISIEKEKKWSNIKYINSNIISCNFINLFF